MEDDIPYHEKHDADVHINRAPTGMKAFVLLCICFLTFGSYWVFDTPGAIETQLKAWFGPTYTNEENALLYSIYSWPNTVLALFGGFIVDRVTGVRAGALLFCSLIFIGQMVFCIGVSAKTYWLCVVGRFIFGLGGESLTVVQNTFVIRWFQGPHLALVFGLVLAFARIGSSVNFVATPLLAENVPLAVWFGLGMCGLSLIMCVLLVIVDYCGKEYVEQQKDHENDMVTNSPHVKGDGAEEDDVDVPKLSQILDFPKSAWILFLICCFFYQGVLTFYQVASDIMQNTGNHYDPTTASTFISIPNFVSIVASPAFGTTIDNNGRSLTFIIIACWGLISCHAGFLALGFGVISISPAYLMFFVGVFYAMGAAAIWPILSVIIPKNMVSTGYGMMTAVQNLGLACFPLIIAALQGMPSVKGTLMEYGLPILVFIGCVSTALCLTIWLLFLDEPGVVGGTRGLLNASATERVALEASGRDSEIEGM